MAKITHHSVDTDMRGYANIKTGLEDVKSSLADIMQVNVKSYGAKGDNSTDDANAFTSALNYANANATPNKRITVFVPKGKYICSSSLTVGQYVDLQMEGTLVYTGALNSPAITIGSSGNQTLYGTYTIRATKQTISDWVASQSIGVKFINVYDANVNIREATRFTIGVQFYAINSGSGYNEVRLDNIGQNKIGLNLYADTAGWVNENLFLGGRFNQNAGVYAGIQRIGIQLEAYGIFQNECNTFVKPSIELLDSNSIPINIIKGRYNKFERVRNEGNNDTIMTVSGDSYYNDVTTSYDYQGNYDPKITQSVYHNFVSNDLQSKFRNRGFANLINIDLYPNAYEYDNTNANGYLKVKGMSYLNNGVISDFVPFLSENVQKVQLNGSTAAIGVKVALGGITEFRVLGRRDFYTDIVIVCYDGSGNVLTSGNDVISPATFGMTYKPSEYSVGAYFSTSTSNYAHYFKFSNNVASAFIGVRCATSSPSGNAILRNFAIDYRLPNNEQVGSSPNVIVDTNQPTNSAFVTRTGIPTRKYHNKGAFYANETGTSVGYICTASGTPGTWAEVGKPVNAKKGTALWSGNGSTTLFTLNHNLGSAPTFHSVAEASADAGTAQISYSYTDATILAVQFKTAPPTGTSNVQVRWKVEN